ncbi:MAG: putative transporter [bacterium]|nr:putative transporter [bacterium]
MDTITNLLAENTIVLLFSVIGLGYLLGNIKILGFNLGIAAVLFVGMAFGALDSRLALPEYIYVIGLVLFVYAVGLQAGPGFFSSFRKRGLRINILTVGLLAAGAIVTLILGRVMSIPYPSIAGLFCGALTNTPALAATVETIKDATANLPPETAKLLVSSPVVTYGIAYPFGVLGVILWFYLFTRWFKIDFAKEEADRLLESSSEQILSRTFRVTNPAIVGKTVEQTMTLMEHPGFIFSRMQRGGHILVPSPGTDLQMGDLIVAVGNADAQERALVLLGELCSEHLAERLEGVSSHRIFVSNKEVVGKTVQELGLQKRFDATITRLRRGSVDFIPNPDTVIELGDRIRIVAREDRMKQINAFFGNELKAISETDFLSLSLGVVLGVFVGMIPFHLPGGTTFKLGFAGGPLIVGLILGRLERTGPISWGLPFSANLVLRQVGLVFFLAAIGTKAGYGFGTTFHSGGVGLIATGVAVTTFVTVGMILMGYKYLKLPMTAVMGLMSGAQTQPACLAYANQQTGSEAPNIWYATVYPASMVVKIILAQVLASFVLRG